MRDEIVKSIGDTLRAKAGATAGEQPRTGAVAHRGNNDAYRLYLVGQRKLSQRGQSVGESIDLFRQAIAIDSLSAEAYSGLSFALAISPNFHPVSTTAVAGEATSSAQRALQLDGKLAQPHVTLGLVLMDNRQWERAEQEFRAALGLDSHDVEARVQYGRYLLFRDRIAEALRQFQSARQDDPASALVSGWTAHTYFLAGHLDSALSELARAIQINPSARSVGSGVTILLAAGQIKEARSLLRAQPLTRPGPLYLTAATGDTAAVIRRLKQLDGELPTPWMAETSRAYGLLGLRDTSRALDALARATAAKENWPSLTALREPVFDGVRASARFRALVKRVGLPENVPSALDAIRLRSARTP